MSELAVEALRVGIAGGHRRWIEVVRGATLRVARGESVGLVGESGSGKTLIARAVLGLLPSGASVLGGRVLLDGAELQAESGSGRSPARRGRIGLVLQEPAGALNPVLTVGAQLFELLAVHRGLRRGEARRAAMALLEKVALPGAPEILSAYPHQLSGGQRQRVLLALALAAGPEYLIADEPTTALDVTVQSRVLALLDRLRRELELGILLISHDLAVVAATCSRAYVVYCGEIVEEGSVEDLFDAPLHPYTRALLASQARLGSPSPRGAMPTITGSVPEPGRLPGGCPFHPRCPAALPRCVNDPPPRVAVVGDRSARCHLSGAKGEP